MEEKKNQKRRKTGQILLWIGRGLGIIPILLFCFIFLPELFKSFYNRHINSGFYQLLPMVIFLGVGGIGYLLSWWQKMTYRNIGRWIILCAVILMGLYVPMLNLILEGQLKEFDAAGMFLLIWGIPGTFIFIAYSFFEKN
ncbi:MAG: hypothetical protein E4G98_02680 [Promethearchaeota archaeon]|nr:MAG: hypothetical protein E4G98_02680 [Candidatus Lokiarchaeota archaeon]